MAKEAKKFDKGKLRTDLIPPNVMLALANVLKHGSEKGYGDFNYRNGKGLDWRRPYGAILRHLLKWYKGEDIDPESGLPHLDEALGEIVILMDLRDHRKGKDDRPKV